MGHRQMENVGQSDAEINRRDCVGANAGCEGVEIYARRVHLTARPPLMSLEVKRLPVELARERLDVIGADLESGGLKGLTDFEIVEIVHSHRKSPELRKSQ
jgi:hypothetical protein